MSTHFPRFSRDRSSFRRRNTPPRSSSNATFARRWKEREKREFFDEKRHNTNFTADSTRHNGHPDTDVLTFCPLFNHFSFSPILPLHRTFAAPDSLFTYSSVLSKKMDRSLLFAWAKNTSRLLGLRVRSSAFDYA